VTFVLNLGVSFFLALWLALRAQDVSPKDSKQIVLTLLRRLRDNPREFFLPPAVDVAPSAEPSP